MGVLFITHELVAKTWTRLVYNMTRIKMEKIFYDEERKTQVEGVIDPMYTVRKNAHVHVCR